LELLHILAKHSKDEYSERQLLSHAFRRLSVTLQAANANIQSRGMQIMQMGDYAALLAARSPLRGHRSTPHYSTPARRIIMSSRLRRGSAAVRRRLFIDATGTDTMHDSHGGVNCADQADGDADVSFDRAASLCHVIGYQNPGRLLSGMINMNMTMHSHKQADVIECYAPATSAR